MPAPNLPWIKFWPELVEHEKFAGLSDAEAWTWIVLWAKASKQPKRWRFASIEHAVRVTGRPAKHLKRLLEVRLIDADEDGIHIHNARKWQDKYPSDYSAKPAESLPDDSVKAADSLPPLSPQIEIEKEIESRDEDTPPATQAPPRGGARRQRAVNAVTEDFKDELEERFEGEFGSREAARDCINEAMSHKALLKRTDHQAYLRNWVRSEAEKAASRRRVSGRRPSIPVVLPVPTERIEGPRMIIREAR